MIFESVSSLYFPHSVHPMLTFPARGKSPPPRWPIAAPLSGQLGFKVNNSGRVRGGELVGVAILSKDPR